VNHPALQPGCVAVITGGASGIGFAAAAALLRLGLRVCIADCNAPALTAAVAELQALAPAQAVMGQVVDVADVAQLQALKDAVYARFGQVNVLMNNAGIGRRNGSWTEPDHWQETLAVNLHGVINGVQVFTRNMLAQGLPGLIINTGSKQGITCPPGNPAYNVAKAAVKALTESLAHELRGVAGGQISAHLLIPGFVYTGMMKPHLPQQPAAAWTPAQTVDFMLERIDVGDFYLLCPDGEVTRAMDEKRIEWAAGDLIHNRPALSRWHPDYTAAFAAHMASPDA
jgi:NAD(P)-dependent dehydrogenase (short-subunit alcohol dehydrogenase family)